MGERLEIANGRYVLEEVLGKGGTATVYRAYDLVFEIPCAIKVLSRELRVHRSLRERLHKEARAMIRLKHTNILRLYDIGVDEEGRDYVVMELAEGGTLGQRLRARGPLPPREALDYGLQILAALDRAHAQGIVHRDVKPDNVLLDAEGVAMLADFGIAMLTEDTLRSTRTNVAMGSLAFMPPEQRLDARSVQPNADLYAVGATLYNLVTGANPIDLFTAEDSSIRWERLPDALRRFLHRATRQRPEERYPSAREMAADLQAVAALFPPDAPPLFEAPSLPPPSSASSSAPSHPAGSRDTFTPLPLQPLPGAPRARPNPTLAPNHDSDADADLPFAPPPEPPPGRRLPLLALAGLAALLAVVVFATPALRSLLTEPSPPPLPPPDLVADEEVITPPPPPERLPPPEAPVVNTAPEVQPEPIVRAPPPPPEVTPPKPEPEPEPEVGPTGASGVAGRWVGSVSGMQMEVVLSGPEGAMQGRVVTSMGPNTETTRMHGSFSQGTLQLQDDAQEYSLVLTLGGGGGRMSGRLQKGAATQPVSLKRVD